ncbi:hypothetical protein DL764_003023 [Monosporascus ibericus]|uniref:CMP/dCMP-type deaminase domain-containing protein n=1 Tax=Monosporascus ibericus TaxID=155417 RepID=A0A4Q4TLI0_9PEZI|nr:hypothetical protein DL764_003023 [Monosporascus ibericus]
MTGHEISGYISNLWQALFASFIQVFTRIFRFTKTRNDPPTPTQRQQPRIPCNHEGPSTPYSLDPNTTTPAHNHGLADQQQHHDGDAQEFDIESGGAASEDEETMPASKKRGAQKRGGANANGKSNGHGPGSGQGLDRRGTGSASTTGQQQIDKGGNTASPGPPPSQQAAPQRPVSNQIPVPAVAAPATNQRDTKPNHQPDSQRQDGARRGGARNRRRSSPTKQGVDDKKENMAPSKDVSQTANSQQPTLTPLAASENKLLPQKPGTHSVTGHGVPVSANQPKNQENMPPNVQVDQLRTAIDGLTFDETPAPAQAPGPSSADAAVGIDAAPLPVPVVVTHPLLNKQSAPKTNFPPPALPGLIEPKTEEERKEREYHLKFMREALEMGQLALNTNETPVGCVLVYHGRIIAKGMNATNVTRNGTRHAEFMALSALFSRKERGDVEGVNNPALDDACWGDVDPSDGHIFPYGQKLHPAPVVDRAIINECVLYVTVEPCVMCASLLRQLGIQKVYFGAVNDKFGGTGGVFRIHLNSKAVSKPDNRPYQNGYGPQDVGRIVRGRVGPIQRDEEDGDGGNVERGYPVEGGYLRDDAVSLLRRFYVQENGRAPQPRKKEGRAARLFAIEAAAKGGSGSDVSDAATLPDTGSDSAGRAQAQS